MGANQSRSHNSEWLSEAYDAGELSLSQTGKSREDTESERRRQAERERRRLDEEQQRENPHSMWGLSSGAYEIRKDDADLLSDETSSAFPESEVSCPPSLSAISYPTHRSLMQAAREGNYERVERALKADISVEGMRDEYPLVVAIAQGHARIVELLLEYGANVNFRHPKHGSMVNMAISNKHWVIARILLTYGASVDELSSWDAAARDRLPEVAFYKDTLHKKWSSLAEVLAEIRGKSWYLKCAIWDWEVPDALTTDSGAFPSLANEVMILASHDADLKTSPTDLHSRLKCMTIHQWLLERVMPSGRERVQTFLSKLESQLSRMLTSNLTETTLSPDVSFRVSGKNSSPSASFELSLQRAHIRIPFERGMTPHDLDDPILELLGLLCTAIRKPVAPGDQIFTLTSPRYHIQRVEYSRRGSKALQYGPGLVITTETAVVSAGDYSCWKELFSSCAITQAGLSPSLEAISERSGFGRGLEISFDLMASLAAVEYRAVIDGGVVFAGYDTILVPTAVSDDGTMVQFHLITRTGGRNRNTTASPKGQINPYTTDLGQRLLVPDLEVSTLRSKRCFLGWCEEAQINLGTHHLRAHVGYSVRGRSINRSLILDGYEAMLQLGTSQAATAVLGLQANYRFTSHRRYFTPYGGYCKLLRDAASETVVVYDDSERRCWLVPKLSLLVHMAHAYVLGCPDKPRDKVPFVEGHADADVLITLLEPLGDEVILGIGAFSVSSLTDILKFRQLLMGLNTNLLITIEATKTSGHGKLHGFEFRDVVKAPGRGSCMQKIDIGKSGRAWLDLVNSADAIVVCSGIGDVITPRSNAPGRRNSDCNTVPCGKDLFTSTVVCLSRLADRHGGAITATAAANANTNLNTGLQTPPPYDSTEKLSVKVSENAFWHPCGDPFRSCSHDRDSPDNCWAKEDLLQRLKKESSSLDILDKFLGFGGNGKTMYKTVSSIPPLGAVVFGTL